MAHLNGTIKRLVSDKGFGFILASDGNEYFFHNSACSDARFDDLHEGQAVTSTAARDRRGREARTCGQPRRASRSQPMNPTEMEALVRSVAVHYGLPLGAVSVAEIADGWSIVVRTATGETFSFAIAAGRPAAMRVAVQEHIEAAR